MVKPAIVQFSQDSQRFYGKDRLDTEMLQAGTQGCRELNCSVANTSTYSVEERQIPSSAAGFRRKADEATDSLVC